MVKNAVDKNTKMEEKETLVGVNSGGSEIETAKDASHPKVVESNVSEKVKVKGDDVSEKVTMGEDDVSGKVKVDVSEKVKVDVSGKVKVDVSEKVDSGKLILLYHPINTKSHRNQQNAIAEVNITD